MAADGGRCISDRAALAGQPALFSDVASISTVRRVLLSVGEAEIDAICQARALAACPRVEGGCGSRACDPRFRATPITSHSEKRQAAGHYKGGFKGGFHPLLVSWGREVLAASCSPAIRARATQRIT
jgi:hypothetical protein